MNEELRLYVESLKNGVPQYVYESLLYLFCIGTVVILVFKGKKIRRGITWLLLTEYILLVFCTTVFYRGAREERLYDYTPFWSYDKPELMAENIMNVAVFLPIGVLLGCAIRSMNWWKALLIGGCLSVSIEFLQLVFKRGFSEVDDVMHNTLGCMMGYGIYSLARVGYERITNRNMGVL